MRVSSIQRVCRGQNFVNFRCVLQNPPETLPGAVPDWPLCDLGVGKVVKNDGPWVPPSSGSLPKVASGLCLVSPLPSDTPQVGPGAPKGRQRRGQGLKKGAEWVWTPREAAPAVIETLRTIGIRRMIMISGDNQQVADAVARAVGLDEARGDLMPDDKVETIKKLRAEAKVAMVGDGVNDAPAMANATVGIAMGAAGSDVALETADVALMADNLNHLPFAVALSRSTSSIIRQNLWFSLGVVALLVPATILGLGIGPAVAVHEGSTIVVVFNALRLLAFRFAPPVTPVGRVSNAEMSV